MNYDYTGKVKVGDRIRYLLDKEAWQNAVVVDDGKNDGIILAVDDKYGRGGFSEDDIVHASKFQVGDRVEYSHFDGSPSHIWTDLVIQEIYFGDNGIKYKAGTHFGKSNLSGEFDEEVLREHTPELTRENPDPDAEAKELAVLLRELLEKADDMIDKLTDLGWDVTLDDLDDVEADVHLTNVTIGRLEEI